MKNFHWGVPAAGPGELLPESSPWSRVEGKSPGNGSMALRGRARVDAPWECLTTWWRRSRPSPRSRGVHGLTPVTAPGREVRVLCPAAHCGLCNGVDLALSSEEHGTGTEPAVPSSPGTLRQLGAAFPAPQLWGCLFVPNPIPAPLNHHGGTGVKSCPKLFLAVLQLGINGLGRAVGKCLLLWAQPLCSVACVKVSTANLHFFRNSLISQMTVVWSRALAAAPVPRP